MLCLKLVFCGESNQTRAKSPDVPYDCMSFKSPFFMHPWDSCPATTSFKQKHEDTNELHGEKLQIDSLFMHKNSTGIHRHQLVRWTWTYTFFKHTHTHINAWSRSNDCKHTLCSRAHKTRTYMHSMRPKIGWLASFETQCQHTHVQQMSHCDIQITSYAQNLGFDGCALKMPRSSTDLIVATAKKQVNPRCTGRDRWFTNAKSSTYKRTGCLLTSCSFRHLSCCIKKSIKSDISWSRLVSWCSNHS